MHMTNFKVAALLQVFLGFGSKLGKEGSQIAQGVTCWKQSTKS